MQCASRFFSPIIRPVTLRAALDNLTNRRYWEFQYADYIAPGEPKTLSLNTRMEF